MGKSKNQKQIGRADVKKYVDDMKTPNFYWTPAGDWIKAHGDGKASTGGVFCTLSQTTSTEEAEYVVKVRHTGVKQDFIVLTFKPDSDGNPPSDAKVVSELRKKCGLGEINE